VSEDDIWPGFASADQTLGWGFKRFNEFDAKCGELLGFVNDVDNRVRDHDPHTGEDVIKVKPDVSLSGDVAQIASEAILHIKHSIDQGLAAACKLLNPCFSQTPRFPWAENAKGVDATLAKSVIPVELHAFIRKCKPYGTGGSGPIEQDQIREMAKMANRKHTVNLTLVPFVNAYAIDSFSGQLTRGWLNLPTWDPVKNELELFRVVADSKFHDKSRVFLQVVFDEGWPMDGVAASKLIAIFGQHSQNVIHGLAREVHRIRG
jgi:hypothetical protein